MADDARSRLIHGNDSRQVYAHEDLTFEESRSALGWLMRGDFDPLLASAFLVALKMKGEKPAEIAGAARAMQEAAVLDCHSRHGVQTEK